MDAFVSGVKRLLADENVPSWDALVAKVATMPANEAQAIRERVRKIQADSELEDARDKLRSRKVALADAERAESQSRRETDSIVHQQNVLIAEATAEINAANIKHGWVVAARERAQAAVTEAEQAIAELELNHV